jgi:hypothetical protein
MKSNITPSTKVTHPNEPDARYSISRMRYVEATGAIESLDIIRMAYGHVFTGTVEQAEAQGFIFHVDAPTSLEFHSKASHVSGEPCKVRGIKWSQEKQEVEMIRIDSLVTGLDIFTGTIDEARAAGFTIEVERIPDDLPVAEVGPEVEELPLTDLAALVAENEETIALLRAEIDQQRNSMETLQNELSKANSRVETFRNMVSKQDDTVTEWAKRMVEQQKLRRADANVLMDALNVPNLPGKFSGTVIFLDGSRLEAVVFEADDEDGWKDRVRDSLEVGTVRVKYEVTLSDDDTTRTIKVDEDNSDYSPDENDSWIDFEDIEEVE